MTSFKELSINPAFIFQLLHSYVSQVRDWTAKLDKSNNVAFWDWKHAQERESQPKPSAQKFHGKHRRKQSATEHCSMSHVFCQDGEKGSLGSSIPEGESETFGAKAMKGEDLWIACQRIHTDEQGKWSHETQNSFYTLSNLRQQPAPAVRSDVLCTDPPLGICLYLFFHQSLTAFQMDLH